MTITPHPDARTLADFGLGRLAAGERDAVEAHVAECPDCCHALAGVAGDTLVDLARAAMSTTTLKPRGDVPAALANHPRYQIIARLGAGGMGTVYKALHQMMGRVVALKIVNPALVADPVALDRFHKEVRLASKLEHPNIVHAYDADEAGGMRFLVMEYVEGVNLQELVARKGPLPVATACHLARQAALGLQHAFEKGMIHRDIKPHNLMVTRKGQLKILDFGLARMSAAPSATVPEMVVGTPDFMAPEQGRDAGAVDIRSDLYALGCTLYYLLTGRPPFAGGTAMEKLVAHAEQPSPSISAARRGTPPKFEAVLNRLLEKDPAKRFQTPAELAAALKPFAKGQAWKETEEDKTVTPKPRKPNRRLVAVGIGVALVGMVVGLLAAVTWSDKAKQSGQKVENVPPEPVNARVLILLPSRGFSDPEYTPIRRALEGAGCKVAVASSVKGFAYPEARGGGKQVTIDARFDTFKPADWDAIVICGGEGVSEYLYHHKPIGPALKTMLEQFVVAGKLVAAIDTGPGLLADAGLLQGRRATGIAMVREKQVKGVAWQDQPVVIDGPIITGRDALAAEPFAAELLSQLRKRSKP